MKDLISIGFILILIGIILTIIGSISTADKTESKFFAGGMIGFIPFGFSNNKKLFYIGLTITIALFILIQFLNK
jgi:uncharacterized membrane protein